MRSPRWRFSLRTMFVALAVASLLFALLSRLNHHRRQRLVAAELSARGANVNLEARPPAWLPGADRLATFVSVVFVDLVGVEIDDAVLDRLSACPEITYLDLSYSDIDDAQVSRLAGLRQLRVLNLSNTRVTDASVATLIETTTLVDLDLTATAVSNEGARRLRKALPHLDLEH